MGMWSGDDLELDGYLDRIGFGGRPTPTLETLTALHRGHTTSIPFENLEIIVGRDVPLDLESLQDKMVRSRRGGYCFEHATLFAAALERIGFRFTALVGRVTLGQGWATRPATHALLAVEVDGEHWLCDVGFGRGPLAPLALRDGTEVDQDGWGFRLSTEPVGDLFDTTRWSLWQRGAEWVDRHSFLLAPQTPVDFRVGSLFVSTAPRSPFTTRLFVQRFGVDAHHTLDGDTVTTVRPDGSQAVRTIEPGELPDLLRDVFDVVVPADDTAALIAAVSA